MPFLRDQEREIGKGTCVFERITVFTVYTFKLRATTTKRYEEDENPRDIGVVKFTFYTLY